MFKKFSLFLLVFVFLFSTVGPSYSIAFASSFTESEVETIDLTEVQQLSNEETIELSNNIEMKEKYNNNRSEIDTSLDNNQLKVDSTLETDLNTGEMLFTGNIREGNESIDVDFEVILTYVENNDFGGKLIDRKTGQEYLFDTKVANASAVPLIIIAVQIVRYGVTWAVKKYGDDIVKAALKSSAHKAASKIKKSLLDDDGVIIGKFTKKVKGKQEYEDPKSGWSISRDVGKNNSHGGSYWKLMDKSGKRIATLDKNGKVLRE